MSDERRVQALSSSNLSDVSREITECPNCGRSTRVIRKSDDVTIILDRFEPYTLERHRCGTPQ